MQTHTAKAEPKGEPRGERSVKKRVLCTIEPKIDGARRAFWHSPYMEWHGIDIRHAPAVLLAAVAVPMLPRAMRHPMCHGHSDSDMTFVYVI